MNEDRAGVEADLVARIARGDEDALSRLYDRYARLLFSLILGIVNDQRDAEEVLQDVFLQVWRQARTFDSSRGSAYRWLVTLARSRAIDRLRSKYFALHRREADSEDPEDVHSSARATQLDAVVILERSESVRRLLDRIAPEQRAALELGYFQGCSQSEIARRLDLPLGTVKSRMRLGLIALRELLPEEMPSVEVQS